MRNPFPKITVKATLYLFFLLATTSCSRFTHSLQRSTVAEGWAGNTVNTAVFRKNSIVTYQNTQFIAFYNPQGFLSLGKRKLNEKQWTVQQTQYKGNVRDAHNIISMMVDGEGFLHVAWDHHNNALRYAQSVSPESLTLTEKMEMVGRDEGRLSYPEFYKLASGNLLFFYRDGGSGGGNLVINSYDVKTKKWSRLQNNLLDGEGERNAYWQACVDDAGVIHISWVWRESPDVASNHDMAYARSKDGGITWENSEGKEYDLPINAASSEYALRIPQNHELINQTSMACDENGNPFIATYWRDEQTDIPQYHLIYHVDKRWQVKSLDFRQTAFSLSGGGTKKIPISRPQIMVKGKGNKASVLLIFRDMERGNKASALTASLRNNFKWKITDLTVNGLSSWEPTYDTELWRQQKILSLFIQNTPQKDGEGLINSPPQPVEVLEWRPKW